MRIIQTNSREIYEKLNMLKHFPEVMIKKKNGMHINHIVNSINNKGKVVEVKKVDNYIILKKVNKMDISVFLR